MIPEIRTGILEVDMGAGDVEEDHLEIEDKIEKEVSFFQMGQNKLQFENYL